MILAPRPGRPQSAYESPRLILCLLISCGFVPAVVAQGPPNGPAVIQLKDSDGHLLSPGAVGRVGHFRFRYGEEVTAVVFSPDGKTLAASGMFNVVRLWDVATGRRLAQAEVSGTYLGRQDDLAFAPDGKTVLAVMGKHSMILRLAESERQNSFALGGRAAQWNNNVRSAFNRPGTQLGVVNDGKLTLYDAASGRMNWSAEVGTGESPYLAQSADGTILAIVTDGTSVRTFAANSGERGVEVDTTEGTFGRVALSPDGATLAVVKTVAGKRGETLELWDLKTKAIRHSLARDGRLNRGGFAFSSDGKRLAVSEPEHFTLVDVGTGKDVWRVPVSRDKAFQPAFSPDGKTIALGHTGYVSLHDAANGALLPQSADPAGEVERVTFLDENRILLWADRYQVWDVTANKPIETYPPVPDDAAYRYWLPHVLPSRPSSASVECSADGSHVCAWIKDGSVTVSDAWTGKPVRKIPIGPIETSRFVLSPDGRTLFTRVAMTVVAWDVATGRENWRADDPRSFAFLTVSPDGRWLASVGRKESSSGPLGFRIWNTATGAEKLAVAVNGANELTAATFSRDDRLAVALLGTGGLGTVRIWDLATGKPSVTIEAKPGFHAVRTLAFSPDGRMLATGGENDAARLWEVTSGLERHRYVYGSKQHAVAFSPSGLTVAYVSVEAPVMLWDVWGTRTENYPPAVAETVTGAWFRMADENGTVAFAAMKQVAWSPAEFVNYAKARLSPVVAADPKKVPGLIDDLGSPVVAVRDAASSTLQAAGDTVVPALRTALAAAESTEKRQRLDRLLKESDDTSPTQFRIVRAIELLERLGSPDAKKLLAVLAAGAPGSRTTKEAKASLARLDRKK